MNTESNTRLIKMEITRTELKYRFDNVLKFIHHNVEKELNIGLLAGIACISEFHFIRVFRDLYGTTPYKYILKFRIKKARDMISRGNRTYSEISSACGFENRQSFRKCFKRETGLNLTEYSHFRQMK